jgi:hypothetical protein
VPVLRVLDRITRRYQRLGYLKRVMKRVNSTSTSNLDNIGNDLVETVLRKVRVPLSTELVSYIRIRLQDRTYQALKDQAAQWLKEGGQPVEVQMELQDIYLADQTLPSQVGKLVKDDWRNYPNLGTNLGFVRTGTFSINTRGLSLLYFTPDIELQAFQEFIPGHNPFLISQKQGLLFLYSLIENDGEVVVPLFTKLAQSNQKTFSDRDAGDLLPEIYRSIIARYRTRSLAIDLRERLEMIEKSAESILKSQSKNAKEYLGGGAREEASRPRLEPYTDIGIFEKPQKMKYEFLLSDVGRRWVDVFHGDEDSDAIEKFLSQRFFHTAAKAWQIPARELTTPDEIVPYLQRAAKAVSSSSGYAPIEELALMGGIWALTDNHTIIEPGVAREALIAYQKTNPYKVRFTVDRSGTLAHARFMDELSI